MTTTTTTDHGAFGEDSSDGALTATGMHRPEHGVLDAIETAVHDEVLHDAALRQSAVRKPR
jgi:hypothetical protein